MRRIRVPKVPQISTRPGGVTHKVTPVRRPADEFQESREWWRHPEYRHQRPADIRRMSTPRLYDELRWLRGYLESKESDETFAIDNISHEQKRLRQRGMRSHAIDNELDRREELGPRARKAIELLQRLRQHHQANLIREHPYYEGMAPIEPGTTPSEKEWLARAGFTPELVRLADRLAKEDRQRRAVYDARQRAGRIRPHPESEP